MRRTLPIIPLILIVLTVLLGIVYGPVSSAIELPSAFKPYALPLLLLLAIVWSIIAIWQYFLQNKSGEGTELPVRLPSREDRRALLARVRSFWIVGVLEQSLHGAAFLTLGLRNQPDVLMNPWHLTLQQGDQAAHTLPANTRIIQVYDEAPSGLLILGEPGSGKTTLLLELARDLVNRAERDESHPMPLVFNLSSWAVKRQMLVEWLVEEMNIKYQIPRHLGQAWMQADQILPLLDGLDEVALPYRAACVEAINVFREQYGLVPLVVCSRWADYQELKPRLLLQSAIVVQPLTQQQIDSYLSSTGRQLEKVREALRDDPVLRELVTTPLMLGVITLAYHNRAGEALEVSGSAKTLRRKLFADYVQAMLKRRGIEPRYTTQRTIAWLTYLAKQQMQHSQTEFYLEGMQPDWLPDSGSRILYRVMVGLFCWLGCGLIYGLIYGLGLIGSQESANWLVGQGVLAVPIYGLAIGLIGGLIVGRKKEINPTEVIAWSWQDMRKGLFAGLKVGLVIGLIVGGLLSCLGISLSGGMSGRLIYGLAFVLIGGELIFGLIGGLVGGLVGGLSGKKMNQRTLVTPNQGIWRSVRNGVLVGLISGPIGGLIVGPHGFGGPIGGLADGLVIGLVFGSIFGPFFGLLGGGDAFIQHFALRWFLWRAGFLPWKYPRFLDYAVACILLRKVGGGYIFIHRLLLEYFAVPDTASPSDEAEN